MVPSVYLLWRRTRQSCASMLIACYWVRHEAEASALRNTDDQYEFYVTDTRLECYPQDYSDLLEKLESVEGTPRSPMSGEKK